MNLCNLLIYRRKIPPPLCRIGDANWAYVKLFCILNQCMYWLYSTKLSKICRISKLVHDNLPKSINKQRCRAGKYILSMVFNVSLSSDLSDFLAPMMRSIREIHSSSYAHEDRPGWKVSVFWEKIAGSSPMFWNNLQR